VIDVDLQVVKDEPSGASLAVAEVPWAKSFSISIYVPVGSRDERPEEHGVAHFIEHMVFKGTEAFSAFELTYAVESVGGNVNAYTCEDYTVYEVRIPTAHAEVAVKVLTQMVFHPIFPEEELALEKEVVLEEIQMYDQTPSDRITDMASEALWGDHPLGRSIVGTEASVKELTIEQVKAFWRKWYHSSKIVVAVASSLNVDFVKGLLQGRLPVLRDIPQEREPWVQGDGKAQTLTETAEGDQAQIAYGYHAPGRRQVRERLACRLLSVILAETMSSRLFVELREKRGLCYQVYSELSTFEDTSGFFIHLGVDASKLSEAEEVLNHELRLLVEKGVTREEFEAAKAFVKGQYEMQFESPGEFSTWLAEGVLFGLDVENPAHSLKALEQISWGEVNQASRLLAETPAIALLKSDV